MMNGENPLEAQASACILYEAGLIAKRNELKNNHAQVQNILSQVVQTAAGWSTLDSWAVDALDSIRMGKPVDIAKLLNDINTWKESNNA
jgi:hypothetical protein